MPEKRFVLERCLRDPERGKFLISALFEAGKLNTKWVFGDFLIEQLFETKKEAFLYCSILGYELYDAGDTIINRLLNDDDFENGYVKLMKLSDFTSEI